MRCGRAQKLIVAAVDGEIPPERRRDLDEHVATCTECRGELHATQALFGALGGLSQEAEVPALVESATLRRMRLAAAEERERQERRWGWFSAPVLAAAGVVVLALVINLRPRGEQGSLRPSTPAASGARQLARASDPVPAPAAAQPETAVAVAPSEPPPDLAAAPELFMNLPIIRNMEKLEHFEAITMVELAPNG